LAGTPLKKKVIHPYPAERNWKNIASYTKCIWCPLCAWDSVSLGN